MATAWKPCWKFISIHALREEGDELFLRIHRPLHHFYPRPPRGGRRRELAGQAYDSVFLSTPSARRATKYLHQPRRTERISIHALREEGDMGPSAHRPKQPVISIHALREEGDDGAKLYPQLAWGFLSTPSARRATPRVSPRCRRRPISIHALREEGDRAMVYLWADLCRFLSTPSARRATALL